MLIGSIKLTGASTRGLLFTAFCLLFLPVTVLLPVERLALGFRTDVEDIFAAPGGRVRRIVTRAKHPVGFAGHWIDRNPPKVDFILRNRRVFSSRLSRGE